MNSRIFTSALSIVAVVATVGVTTYAFFSDSGTSSNNVFSTGTLDLKLSDANETDQDDVTATWNNTSLIPGGASVDGTLSLKNSGTVAGNHAHVALANVLSDNVNAMDKYMKITTLEYDANGDTDYADGGENLLASVTDSNSNGFADLQDWAALAGTHSISGSLQLPLTDTGVNHGLHVTVQLDSSAPNTIQGDSVTSTFTVTLHQDATQ
jgi:spore coat-associated protein N